MKQPGLYGLEMVKQSSKLKRATIYVHLSRMEDKGWLRSEAEKVATVSGMPRRRYFVTGEGQNTYRAANAAATAFNSFGGVAI